MRATALARDHVVESQPQTVVRRRENSAAVHAIKPVTGVDGQTCRAADPRRTPPLPSAPINTLHLRPCRHTHHVSYSDTVKSQTVRLFDIGLIGPLMVWGGARAIEERPAAGILLALLGLATVSYNAVNYSKTARRTHLFSGRK